MNQYKDTTKKLNTPKSANKRHIERFISDLLDCLLIAGMMLFLLLVVTNCQPARATYENTSQVSISQAMPKHSLNIGNDIGNTGNESGNA